MDEGKLSWRLLGFVLILYGVSGFVGEVPGVHDESCDRGVGDAEIVLFPLDERELVALAEARVGRVASNAVVDDHLAHVAKQANGVGFLIVVAGFSSEDFHAYAASERVFPEFDSGYVIGRVVLRE